MSDKNKELVISFDSNDIDIQVTNEKPVELSFGETIVVKGRTDHSELDNLDYEHSGHTGFASSQELSILASNVEQELSILGNSKVPKDLSILPSVSSNDDRSQMTIYIDNNGTPSKANLKDTLGTILRLDNETPSDMQNGEFLMLDLTLNGLLNKN